MRQEPYISITGFMTSQEVIAVRAALPAQPPRQLVVGILVSSTTLAGDNNKNPGRYPPVDHWSKICLDHPHLLNLVHFNTNDVARLPDQMCEVARRIGSSLHGLQMNVAWPSVDLVRAYRQHSRHRLVLQIGWRAFSEVDHDPGKLARRVAKYDGVIDDILIDASGGKGRPLETDRAFLYLRAIRALAPGIGLGVAGGLSPTSLHLVEPLLQHFPDLSIDAEACLRDPFDDSLDLARATDYVQRASTMFSGWR